MDREQKHGYSDPFTWHMVPGGRIYSAPGHGITFVPDVEPIREELAKIRTELQQIQRNTAR